MQRDRSYELPWALNQRYPLESESMSCCHSAKLEEAAVAAEAPFVAAGKMAVLVVLLEAARAAVLV